MIDLKGLPSLPGCYLYKDSLGSIIYVGKAKDLKKRVSSYFQKKDHDPKTLALVSNIGSVDFIVTDSEVEALILENNLVKKHQPKYNISLKDSKRFAYIALTHEEFPRVLLARDQAQEATFFGPFVSAAERDIIIDTINEHFQLRTCRKLPKRPCTRFYIKLCPAPCIGNISKESYGENVSRARMILKGHTTSLARELKEEMKTRSASMEFERALDLRNQLFALERLEERQKMERQKEHDEDVIAYATKEDKVYVLVFNVYQGMLINKKEFVFDKTEDFFTEFIVRYYGENRVPGELILQEDVGDALLEFLQKISKKKVRKIVPQKGDKKDLLDLAQKNIEITFFANISKLEELQKRLRLQETPAVIECFDISHLSGTSMVGSMVQFRNGVPYKSGYRRFRIRTVTQVDDTAAIAEIVGRRYYRLVKENIEFPHLIIIDGGKGQLNAALDALQRLNIKVPVVSLAKRLEEIYVPGLPYPLQLDRKDKALQLMQTIRDEAHRFAIKYNRLLRSKNLNKKRTS